MPYVWKVNLKKRTWCYIQPPPTYSITCDICGGSNLAWSEWAHKIWCFDCEKDTPGTDGILDGPIPYEVAKMLGISFDRIDLKTGERLYMKVKDDKIVWVKNP